MSTPLARLRIAPRWHPRHLLPLAWAGRRSPGAGRRELPRPGRAWLLALPVVAALLAGGWLWFRDSSLVAIQRVSVIGASGPDAARIRAALASRARTMSTLDVDPAQLRAAVAAYPVVKGVRVSTDFPHGARIDVFEQIPVGAVRIDGRAVPVASDGMILRDGTGGASLPLISLAVPPGGSRLRDGEGAAAIALLDAAPFELLSRIAAVRQDPAHGLVAQLRRGPELRFGSAADAARKWSAAVAVLAGGQAAGASYLDVSDPARPAAGVTSSPARAGVPGAGTTSTAPSSTSTSG